jgi:hypothetical protein
MKFSNMQEKLKRYDLQQNDQKYVLSSTLLYFF